MQKAEQNRSHALAPTRSPLPEGEGASGRYGRALLFVAACAVYRSFCRFGVAPAAYIVGPLLAQTGYFPYSGIMARGALEWQSLMLFVGKADVTPGSGELNNVSS